MMKKINLGIRGGGVKTPAIGMLKAFEENGIEVATVSGASIGAVIATLSAVGRNADDIFRLLSKFVVAYSKANRLRGGKGSKIIEATIDKECGYLKFKDLEKPLYITANAGGLWNTVEFLFSKETTPDITLGQACRASCSFPFAYERYKLNVNGKEMKFYDGGMVNNPYLLFTPNEVTVLATFEKSKINLKSRYKNAWLLPEKKADFIIKPYVGKMGSFGTPKDIKMSKILGYYAAIEKIDDLIKSL